MRRRSLLPIACAALIALIGCQSESEDVETKCDKLRQHVVELRTRFLPERDRAAHASALTNAIGPQFLADCNAMTVKQLNCALAASDTTSLAECAAAASP